MTKWKLVPVDCWRELEPYLGKDVPNREVVLLSDVKGVLAAPQPEPLSDERILDIWASNSGRPVTMGKARIIAQARAIEREILGGGECG